jgi:thiol-disulfide isomerase/thioredoxin
MEVMDSRCPAFRTVVSLTLIIGLATACGRAPSQRRTAAPTCPRVAAPEGLTAPLLPRTTCSLPQFDPTRFRELLGQLRGVPVVVNIWGSWCGPCLREAPELSRVAREFEGRVQFLGVDINDLRVPAANFIRRFGWPYPSVFDPPGAIRDALGLVGQPHTLVFDAAGRRTLVHPGAITKRQLRTELRKLVGRTAPTGQP